MTNFCQSAHPLFKATQNKWTEIMCPKKLFKAEKA